MFFPSVGGRSGRGHKLRRLPSGVGNLEHVGGCLIPDLEKILALKPDLVVVYATQTDLRRQLERARVGNV